MTRAGASLAIVLVLGPAIPTAAQPSPQARIALVNQDPLTGPRSPLRISVEVTNTGTRAIERFGLTLHVYQPARSRSQYREAIAHDPTLSPILVTPIRTQETLRPGETTTIAIRRRLPEIAQRDESALHPLKLQVESDGVPVTALRSVLVFIGERQEVPLDLSLTVVLDERVLFDASGTFRGDRLERSLAAGGRLETTVAALEQAPMPVTVAIGPALLLQLQRMSTGYRVRAANGSVREVGEEEPGAVRAAQMLERLEALVARGTVETIALPLASPSIPALVDGQLRDDLELQMEGGTSVLRHFLPDATVAGTLVRPPRSLLTPRAIRVLERVGSEGLVLDAEALAPAAEPRFSAVAVSAVEGGRGRTLPAIAPDAATMKHVLAPAPDPRLQAQLALGEMAAVYFEQPGTPRGFALVIGDDDAPAEAVLSRLLGAIRRTSVSVSPRAGWLRPRRATRLIDLARARGDLPRRRLEPRDLPRFSPAFLVEIRRARAAIGQLSSIADETAPLVRRLQTQRLLAESAEFAEREAEGLAFLRSVRRRVALEFRKVAPPDDLSVTLTSHRGVIPVTLSSRAEYPVRLRVTLVSPRLRFVEGATREVLLDRPRRAVTFPVLARTTGRFPVRVLLQTPRGARIAESRITVRSTAYNTRALVVTLAAALFLLVLWGRRSLSARR
ncbi:MAG TPA: DUF6049 family protein [Actinomycetota bacterium]|nr:DUF6049 family protein [Actinomycetota bacterium]